MLGPLVEMCRRFHAMNTDVEIVVCTNRDRQKDAEQALSEVQTLFVDIENNLSRFHSQSELSQLNASSGYPFHASALLFAVVGAALEAAKNTNGLFDPTILPDLLIAGYDRSFEKITFRVDNPETSYQPGSFSWRDVHLDPVKHTIYLPEGCSIDLGGIGKGWTVDRACDVLNKFISFGVDAGGDIALRGRRADGSPWTVGVADPFEPGKDLTLLSIDKGAVCTSSTMRRRWVSTGEWHHHIIDPRTGKPSDSGVVAVTIKAESAVKAETIAKATLISGKDYGIDFVEKHRDVSGLMILNNGSIIRSSRFPEDCRVA